MEYFKGNSSRENRIRPALALLWWALEKEHPHILGSWVLSYMVFLSQFFPRSNHLSSTNNHTLLFKRLRFSYCRTLAIRVAVQSQGLGINNKLFSNAFLWKKEREHWQDSDGTWRSMCLSLRDWHPALKVWSYRSDQRFNLFFQQSHMSK